MIIEIAYFYVLRAMEKKNMTSSLEYFLLLCLEKLLNY